MRLNFDDTFNKELRADPIITTDRRQVQNAHYSFVTPRIPSKPSVIHVSDDMLQMVGLTKEEGQSEVFKNIVTGADVYPQTSPYAMCYGGHQFGHWAGQLGDGRAINLGEIIHNNARWALQLKGAGVTPYSRSADGFAVLRSSIREHLCSEAMHHLGVPSTRSLSLSLTGDQVMRDMMYDGHPALEKGAVVCRVAPSFIRFGNFEIFASRKDTASLKQLANYTIETYFSKISSTGTARYIDFFNEVLDRTLEMIIHWQRVGFVHGVMNTDNLSILGLTIDYGPYGWLEGYDKGWTPNTTDKQNKRYRYGNQPYIGLWNLYQLANALYLLVGDSKPFELALDRYKNQYTIKYLEMMRSKLGLNLQLKEDARIVDELENILEVSETDMTIFFRLLSTVQKEDLPSQALKKVMASFYRVDEIQDRIKANWISWFEAYIDRLQLETIDDEERQNSMNIINPKYVLRNYMAQLAIDDANKGDYKLIDDLYTMLRNPYDEQKENEKWFAKRPDWARYKVGCSMLSCSS